MSANQAPTADVEDVMMVDETIPAAEDTYDLVPAGAATSGTMSTLAFRPLSPAPAPADAPMGIVAASKALPPLLQVMPPRAVNDAIFALHDENHYASHFVFAGAGVQNPDQRYLFMAAGVTQLDHEVRVMKEEMGEEVVSNFGYVEALRLHQKKTNLWVHGLVDLIAKHGTPELKLGLKNLREEIKAEEEKIDDLWRRKKAGTKWTDLNDDYL